MRKIMYTLIVALLLTGCAAKPNKIPTEPKRIIHPEMPTPVGDYKFDWQVVVIDEKTVVIGLEYDQSIDFKIFLEEIKRYIGESNVILCSYRKDLNERGCVR